MRLSSVSAFKEGIFLGGVNKFLKIILSKVNNFSENGAVGQINL